MPRSPVFQVSSASSGLQSAIAGHKESVSRMNKAHKSIWNESLGTYVAASEAVASGGSKTSSTRKARHHLGRSPTQRLALEPRIVFDGAMAVEGLSAVEREVSGSTLVSVQRVATLKTGPLRRKQICCELYRKNRPKQILSGPRNVHLLTRLALLPHPKPLK